MRSFVLGLAATLAFAGVAFAQAPEVLRGTSTTIRKKVAPAKHAAAQHTAAAQHAATAHHPVSIPVRSRVVTPQSLRGSRYGGFAPSVPEPPPVLDTTSPRTLSLTNVNTNESLTVTYWSDGAYRREALNQLNHFLRDSKTGEQTEMDPLLFDVLWHTEEITGFHGTVEVLSGYRSPETNAWLASVSRGVARDSQHMNGNAMDIRFPGVPVFKIRQAGRALQMGGVGFYPRSGFVHLDTGPIRYW
ncbi:MAG: DUF882 domain-containing protein [Proteobacteria bacterium]|nr:DUF882 domain-containing protein [Pseudomonadota bacterium]